MPKKTEPFHLEDSITRLNEIVEQLEHGDLSLEKSLRLYEEGIALSNTCRDYLDRADQKISDLSTRSTAEKDLS